MTMLKSLFLLLFIMGCVFLLQNCSPLHPYHQRVDADEFAQTIADTGVVCVDVRTPEEYAEGHITGAINIDVLREDFLSRATSMLPLHHTIALYCASGKRSRKAARMLAKKGYHVVELKSGYKGWMKANK